MSSALHHGNLDPALLATGPIPFTCSVAQNGEGSAWVRPAGELDLDTAPQLARHLALAHAGSRMVVLDLGGVCFIDSAGVHAIVDATRRAARMGQRLVTIRPAPADDIFEITGTADHLDAFVVDGSRLAPAKGPA